MSPGPKGEIADPGLIEHSERFRPKRWTVTDRVHCLVGWGLANCTVIEAPDGLVVVDTGESVEEANDHIAQTRSFTEAPVAAIVYSHFHYVSGTSAWLSGIDHPIPIWAHHKLPGNVAGSTAETGPSWIRRALTQFGVFLPHEGPDAMPNMGIGPFMFNPEHTTRTAGYEPPTDVATEFPAAVELGGLDAVLHSAPSDADDSLVIHFPDLGVAINNNLWPALFNIYPLRGEPYRDPQILLEGLDLLRDLEPEHLVGVHGPPISGHEEVQRALLDYRDTIQFLWDQTVRAINRGIDPDVLSHEIVLPPRLARSPYARQHYGLVRHHVRQIHGGVLGWWGNDGAELMAHHPAEEARRIVAGFGGRGAMLAQLETALERDDAPWAARLGSWLLRVDPDDDDARRGKAAALRRIGQTTTSANVRAFTLTEARELEGSTDRSALTRPIVSRHQVRTAPAETYLRALRVQIDPDRAADLHRRLVVHLDDAEPMALHVRGGVAAFESPPRGEADLLLELDLDAWADLICGKESVGALLDSDRARLAVGSVTELSGYFDAFPDALVRTGS